MKVSRQLEVMERDYKRYVLELQVTNARHFKYVGKDNRRAEYYQSLAKYYVSLVSITQAAIEYMKQEAF